jgi:hypothetical protein
MTKLSGLLTRSSSPFNGFTGSTGELGFTGSQGPIGLTGSVGATGFAGSKGDIGFAGSRGADGAAGFTGSQGVAGNTGFTGSQGAQGPIGLTGSIGATGFAGSQGDIGFTGSRGNTGFTGSQGIQGFTGSQGVIGFTGSQGIQGVIGFTGSQGFTGSAGPSTTINAANDNTATTHFPVFVAGTGNQTARLSNSGNILSFVPSTGTLNSVDFNSTSDATLKENIVNIENALEKVLSINGVSFNFKEHNTKKRVGVIAQEIETVLPEAVSINSEGYKTVSYGNLAALFIEAIKELKKEISDMKKSE